MKEEYSHPALDKVAFLKKRFENPAFTSDLEQIDQWEKQILTLLAREEVAQHSEIKLMVKDLTEHIHQIDELLLNTPSFSFPDIVRDRKIDEKKMYKDFLKRFDLTEIREELTAVDKTLQEEIDSMEKGV